jgi:hypothetical protein
MNMNPDKETLLLWLEDELLQEEQMLVDAWAADQPVWLAKREASRQWRSQIGQIMAPTADLPYGEFFQSRLMRTIEQSTQVTQTTLVHSSRGAAWRKWMLPLSVAAAMIIGFIGGRQWQDKPHRAKTLVTYTPEEGVKAEFFETSPAEGTVIVLNGVEALPDEFADITTTATPTLDLRDPSEKKRDAAILVAP